MLGYLHFAFHRDVSIECSVDINNLLIWFEQDRLDTVRVIGVIVTIVLNTRAMQRYLALLLIPKLH